jgi:3-oxoacyl-[acyl-carrier protein] reductase
MSRGALVDKVALVTGGSRGIGAAISRVLAGEGATVAVNYVRDAEAAEQVAAELEPRGSVWQADVSDHAEVSEMVDKVIAHHGRLDVLVVNAGTWRGAKIEELEPADWATVLATSLTGTYNLVQAAAPALRGAAGRIVVMSSVIGITGFPGDSAYASAKAGLFGFVRSLAKEMGRDGVTVNAVAPGLIDTSMIADVDPKNRERMLRRTALRRLGETDEVAAAVRYLACDASYVTGHTLVVDGGFSL